MWVVTRRGRTLLTHTTGLVVYGLAFLGSALTFWSAGLANTTCQPDERPALPLGTVRLVALICGVVLAGVCGAVVAVLHWWCRAPRWHALPWSLLCLLSLLGGVVVAVTVEQGHWCF